MSGEKLSMIVVTKRPEFREAWLHQVEAIMWDGPKELVVLEHVTRPYHPPLTIKPGGTIVRVDHRKAGEDLPVHRLRTTALTRATGNFITWVDDDDWRHPLLTEECRRRMRTQTGPIAHVVGPRVLVYTTPHGDRFTSYTTPKEHPVFPASLFRPTVKSTPFPDIEPGSDTAWMTELRRAGRVIVSWEGWPNYVAVSHGANHSCPEPLGEPLDAQTLRKLMEAEDADLGQPEPGKDLLSHLARLRECRGIVEWEFGK